MLLRMDIDSLLQDALLSVKAIKLLIQLLRFNVVSFRVLNAHSIMISDGVQLAQTVSKLT